jgi:divalent metal cation (Fe/Co/Zn/Cd) transporter
MRRELRHLKRVATCWAAASLSLAGLDSKKLLPVIGIFVVGMFFHTAFWVIQLMLKSLLQPAKSKYSPEEIARILELVEQYRQSQANTQAG